MSALTDADRTFFKEHGYIVRTDILPEADLAASVDLFDRDLKERSYRWHAYGYHQRANYDALVTSPALDTVVRHPAILGAVSDLMGGPVCFGEIGARLMRPYEGKTHRSWHRDRPHWLDHPYRMDYIQAMIYLTDVNAETHCFSISPESVTDPILKDADAQLARGGCTDIHGPAGTVCLFNVAVLHTATTRPTTVERRTVQTYYGHRERPPLANDSVVPSVLWGDASDAETREFYGNLNDVTRLYGEAFGARLPDARKS